jgi:hypothetical protein
MISPRLIALGGCALLIAACGSSSGASNAAPDLVTPDQAKQAFQTLVRGTSSSFLRQETEPLRSIDQAGLVVNPPPSPEPTLPPGISHHVTVWISHQRAYPVSFLCLDKVTSSGQAVPPQLFRLVKVSASAPWTVSHQVLLLGPTNVPSMALDSSGYAQVVTPDRYGELLVSPAQLTSDYAAYLTAGNGADNHEFAPGAVTSMQADAVKKIGSQATAHTAVTKTISPLDDPVQAYLLRDGGALVVTGVRWALRTVADGTGTLDITKDGKGVLAPAPGRYRDVTSVTMELLAFTVPAKGSKDKVNGLGIYSGPVSSTGTRA